MAKRTKKERMKTIDLGPERTRALVHYIQAAPCLWNTKDPQYKDKELQAETWVAISDEMGVSVPDLKYKWSSVQSSYRHFWILYQKDGTVNSQIPEHSDLPRKRWYLYDDMLFLSGCNGKEKTPEKIHLSSTFVDPDYHTETEIEDPLEITSRQIDTTASSSSTIASTPPVIRTHIKPRLSRIVQQGSYTEEKVYQTKLTYEQGNLQGPSNVSTANSKVIKVGGCSYNDGLRYGQNLGKILSQWSPQRRQAAMIKIDEIILEAEKARYRHHYGTDP